MYITEIILQNGEKRYKYAEQYTDARTGKKKIAYVTLAKNTNVAKKEAQRLLIEKIENKQEFTDVDKVTLGELIIKYNDYQSKIVKQSTQVRNKFSCAQIEKILGSDTLLTSLSAGYVNKKMSDSIENVTTYNEFQTRLKALLRWGYKNDYINDIRFLIKLEKKKDRQKKQKLEEKFLESHEVSTLLDGMTHQMWKLLTRFMVLSGLRIGEVIALENADIDYTTRMINVNKTYDVINCIVTSTKTETSERKVYMQDSLLDCVKEIQSYMVEHRKVFGYKSNRLLFRSEIGSYVQYHAYNKYLRENGIRLLNRRDLTTHVLRHTHASLFLEQGIDVDTISKRLGHSDSKITKQIYLHITDKLESIQNERLRTIEII